MQKYTLYNGDCLEYMKKIKTSSVDLIVTDPPYNLGKFMENRDTNLGKMRDNFFGIAGWDDLDFKEWKQSMNKFFRQAARVLKDGGSMIVFMSIIKVETLISVAEKNGFYYKTTGIWHKLNPMPRNMNLHFVNSTEAWVYFTYKATQDDTQGDTQDDTEEKIIKMIKDNPQVSTADMAKELKIGIATVKRKIKKMSNVSYVGSGYSGHWEING